MGTFMALGTGAALGAIISKTASALTVFPFVRDKEKRQNINGRNALRGAFLATIFVGYHAISPINQYVSDEYHDYYGIEQTVNNKSKLTFN